MPNSQQPSGVIDGDNRVSFVLSILNGHMPHECLESHRHGVASYHNLVMIRCLAGRIELSAHVEGNHTLGGVIVIHSRTVHAS